MKAMNLLLILSTITASLAIVPTAQAGPGTCLIGTSYCFCVVFGCIDDGTGHGCSASFGWTNNSQQGYLCNAQGFVGTIDVVNLERGSCKSTAAIAVTHNAGRWKYDQSHASAINSPNPCENSITLTSFRSYTDVDSAFAASPGRLTIVHYAQGANGPVRETTLLETRGDDVWFQQQFVSLVTGKPTWQASGLLTGASLPTAN